MIERDPHLRLIDYTGNVMLCPLDQLDRLAEGKNRNDLFIKLVTMRGVEVWLDPASITACYVIDERALHLVDEYNQVGDYATEMRKLGIDGRNDDEEDAEIDGFFRYLNGLNP